MQLESSGHDTRFSRPNRRYIHPAYTFAESPNLDSVFHSPVVGQATDDDGDGLIGEQDTPDIAVLMGDEFDAYETAYWSAFDHLGDG